MKRYRPLALFVLFCLAFFVAGCPMGYKAGADAATSVRGATQAADLPPGMPQTTAGQSYGADGHGGAESHGKPVGPVEGVSEGAVATTGGH